MLMPGRWCLALHLPYLSSWKLEMVLVPHLHLPQSSILQKPYRHQLGKDLEETFGNPVPVPAKVTFLRQA